MSDQPVMPFKEKLFELQKRVEPLLKDKPNPYFNSKYSDVNDVLREVKPHCHDLRMILLQPTSIVEGRNALKTIIMNLDGDEELTEIVLLPDIQDPQKVGSAITYMRRYSIKSLLGLEDEDDDGNRASGKVDKPEGALSVKEYQAKVSTPVANLNIATGEIEEIPLPTDEPSYSQVEEPFSGKPWNKWEQAQQSNTCADCGAPKVESKNKPDTWYCSKKCWLNK